MAISSFTSLNVRFGGELPKPNGKYKVVVVGNGIGGIAVGRELTKLLKCKPDLAEITIIGKNDRFVFKPMLPDALNWDASSIAMTDVFKPSGPVKFKKGEATDFQVDPAKKTVTLGDKTEVPFDYLVLATGAKTNYFNIAGAEAHSLALEEENNLEAIRQTAVKKLEEAVKSDFNSTEQGRNLSFVIVGGGATGVELAFELKHYMDKLIAERFPKLQFRRPRITLVEATNAILPGFTEKERAFAVKRLQDHGIELLLNSKVRGVTEDGILKVTDAGQTPPREYNIHTIAPMWVTGVKANPVVEKLPFEKVGFKRQVKVNEQLEIPDRPDVYALGDMALKTDPANPGKFLGDTGQVAEQQGTYVARDLFAKMKTGKADPKRPGFRFFNKGVMLSMGPKDGFMRVMERFLLTGGIASRVRQMLYSKKMKG